MSELPSLSVSRTPALLLQAWRAGFQAALPATPWLLLFALTGGVYAYGLVAEVSVWVPVAGAILTFLAGTELSRRLYQWLIPGARPAFLALAHANLAVYAAFAFIGFFIGFFLLVLPGILIEAAGSHDIDSDSDPALVQEAFLAMLGTPYGIFYILVCLAGALLLCWMALRLTLYGAATAATGQAMVFRSWDATKGLVLPLALACLGTHVVPFAAAGAANLALQTLLPASPVGSFTGTVAGIVLFAPFLLAGHALSAGLWRERSAAGVSPAG